MKKLIFLIVVMLFFCVSCTANHDIESGDSYELLQRYENTTFNIGTLRSYSVENEYHVYTLIYGKILCIAKFDTERNLLASENIDFITESDADSLIGKSLEEVYSACGKPHAIAGGYTSPVYITRDGYALWLILSEPFPAGVVARVEKMDLFTGEFLS